MATLILQIPDSLKNKHDEITKFIAAKLFEAEKITLGQAAVMCNMEKWAFGEILIDYGIHYFDGSAATDLAKYKTAINKNI